MTFSERPRSTRSQRAALSAAVAALGAGTYSGFALLSLPAGAASPTASTGIGVQWALLIWIAIGATAGMFSSRFRDAPVSGAFGLIGALLSLPVCSMLSRSLRDPSVDLVMPIVYTAIIMLPTIAGGHLLAVGAVRVAMGALKKP